MHKLTTNKIIALGSMFCQKTNINKTVLNNERNTLLKVICLFVFIRRSCLQKAQKHFFELFAILYKLFCYSFRLNAIFITLYLAFKRSARLVITLHHLPSVQLMLN